MSYQHLMQFFFSNSPLMRFYCTKVSLALCHHIRWFLSYQQLTPSRLISWLIKRRLLSCLCNQKSPTGEITTRPLRCVSQVQWSHESITRLFRRIPILVAGRRNYTYSEQCYLTCQKCTDILLMANKLTFIHPLDCLPGHFAGGGGWWPEIPSHQKTFRRSLHSEFWRNSCKIKSLRSFYWRSVI